MKITASFRRCVKIKRHCGGLATFPDGDMLPVQYHSRRLIMEHLIDRINWRMMEFYSGEDSRRIGIPSACMTTPGCWRPWVLPAGN